MPVSHSSWSVTQCYLLRSSVVGHSQGFSEMSEAAKKYLVAEYVPQLLKTRSILQDSDKSDYVIDLCRVLPVATDGTFMLSLCNRVKVDLKEVGNNENILHLDLVIKVSKLCTCVIRTSRGH